MAFEYIGALLEEAVQTTASVEVRGRVEQVVGTIIRAVVPGVKGGELCILRNPWEDWTLRAEVVGFVEAPSDVRRDLKLRILRRLIEEIDLRKGDLGYLHDPVKRQEMHVRVEGKLVALVQNDATGEIVQAVQVDVK